MFRYGLNEPTRSLLPGGGFNCSLRDIMDYALLLCGSPFTVGEAEPLPKTATITDTFHKMAACPDKAPVPKYRPEREPVPESIPERAPVSESNPESASVPESSSEIISVHDQCPCLFPLMISVLCLLQPRNKAPCSLLNSLDCWISQKWINFRSSSSPTFAPEFTPVHVSAPESAPVYESDPESAPVPAATSVAEPPLTVAELFTELMVFPVTYVPTTDSPCFLKPLLQPQVPSLNSLYPLKLLLLPLQNLQRWWRPLQNI